jgi:hypothetical protein
MQMVRLCLVHRVASMKTGAATAGAATGTFPGCRSPSECVTSASLVVLSGSRGRRRSPPPYRRFLGGFRPPLPPPPEARPKILLQPAQFMGHRTGEMFQQSSRSSTAGSRKPRPPGLGPSARMTLWVKSRTCPWVLWGRRRWACLWSRLETPLRPFRLPRSRSPPMICRIG